MHSRLCYGQWQFLHIGPPSALRDLLLVHPDFPDHIVYGVQIVEGFGQRENYQITCARGALGGNRSSVGDDIWDDGRPHPVGDGDCPVVSDLIGGVVSHCQGEVVLARLLRLVPLGDVEVHAIDLAALEEAVREHERIHPSMTPPL